MTATGSSQGASLEPKAGMGAGDLAQHIFPIKQGCRPSVPSPNPECLDTQLLHCRPPYPSVANLKVLAQLAFMLSPSYYAVLVKDQAKQFLKTWVLHGHFSSFIYNQNLFIANRVNFSNRLSRKCCNRGIVRTFCEP